MIILTGMVVLATLVTVSRVIGIFKELSEKECETFNSTILAVIRHLKAIDYLILIINPLGCFFLIMFIGYGSVIKFLES